MGQIQNNAQRAYESKVHSKIMLLPAKERSRLDNLVTEYFDIKQSLEFDIKRLTGFSPSAGLFDRLYQSSNTLRINTEDLPS